MSSIHNNNCILLIWSGTISSFLHIKQMQEPFGALFILLSRTSITTVIPKSHNALQHLVYYLAYFLAYEQK